MTSLVRPVQTITTAGAGAFSAPLDASAQTGLWIAFKVFLFREGDDFAAVFGLGDDTTPDSSIVLATPNSETMLLRLGNNSDFSYSGIDQPSVRAWHSIMIHSELGSPPEFWVDTAPVPLVRNDGNGSGHFVNGTFEIGHSAIINNHRDMITGLWGVWAGTEAMTDADRGKLDASLPPSVVHPGGLMLEVVDF